MANVNRLSGTAGFAQGNQQSIIEAFNSSTYISDQVDVQDTPVYDTVTIAAGGSVTNNTVSWFTSVGPGSGKTLAQTNMVTAGKLNAPEAFSIMSFRLRWSENILPADLYAILNGFALQFTIGTKPYQTGPLWNYSAGGGIFGTSTNATPVVTSLLSNGNPGRMHMHRLAIPLVIENQATFYANLVGNAATLTASGGGGTGATLQLMLSGLYARGVQ
jgi:hypothetical protein